MASGKPFDNSLWTEWKDSVIARSNDEAIRIVETLTKLSAESGGKWKGLSPWRKERTASFFLFPDGRCHDFGTGESKDAVGALQLAKGLTFPEALAECAALLGMPSWEDLKKEKGTSGKLDPAELDELHRWQGEERRVQELMTRLVHRCNRTLPKRIRAFIHTRYGLSDETIDLEKIGWIPAGLYEGCKAEWPEISDDDWLATGFFHQSGRSITTARSQRILFPYWRGGLVVYSIARLYDPPGDAVLADWEKAKYQKHSTYDKEKRPYISSTISNKWFWNEDVLGIGRKNTSLLVTEGIADGLSVKQIGIPVISPVTISFREQDYERLIELAKRHVAGRVVVINDNEGNDAGKKGSLKTAKRLWQAGQRCGVGILPKKEGVEKIDLNDFIRDHLASGKTEEDVKIVVDGLMRDALDYPQFLLSEIPKDTKAVDLEKYVPDLAAAMVPMSLLARDDFGRAIKKRFSVTPGVLQKEVDRELKTALKEAKEKGWSIEGIAGKPSKETSESEDGGSGNGDDGKKKKADGDGGDPNRRKTHEGLRGAVTVHPGGYYERMGTTGKEQISTFCLILTCVLRTPLEPDRYVVRIEGPDEGTFALPGTREVICKEWVVPHNAWSGKKAFLAAFPTPDAQYTGDDVEVQGMLALLSDKSVRDAVPLVFATPIAGRHKATDGTFRFVLPTGTLNSDGWMETPDVIYTPTGSTIDSWLPSKRTPIDGPEVSEIAREAIPLILQAQPFNVSLTSLCWILSSLFAPDLRKRIGGYPILNPWGTFGSGKSTFMREAITSLIYEKSGSLSATATSFAIIRGMSCTSSLPVLFDEYKPADMTNAVSFRRRIRTAYSGETEARGHGDQSVSNYPLQAPIIVAGETRIEGDPALVDRTLYAPYDKPWLDKHPEAVAAMGRLQQLPLWQIGPTLFAWSLGAPVDLILEEAKAIWSACAASLTGHRTPTRMANNIIINLFGLVALRRWSAQFGVTLPEISTTSHVLRLLSDIYASPDGSTKIQPPLDTCDHFVMRSQVLIALGLAIQGIHWDYGPEDGQIIIHISSMETLAQIEATRRGETLDSPGINSVLRAFREKKAVQTNGTNYIVNCSVIHWMRPEKGRRVHQRCLLIDTTKLPASMGLVPEAFPSEKNDTAFPETKPVTPDAQKMIDAKVAEILARRSPN